MAAKAKVATWPAPSTSALPELISDQLLRRLIITGRPDLGMPSYRDHNGRSADYRSLTSQEVDDLVALLATWRRSSTPSHCLRLTR